MTGLNHGHVPKVDHADAIAAAEIFNHLMNFAFKMMNFVFTVMNFVLK